ncbi:thioredoxin domain-containing protein [Candidatus Villigracilis affinis]|uniref:thioredoxin domain-containing protein n=1 Tax=Candidatus Villigracilis affinis TaxID=3140682 RepID=UPI001DA6E869|nr:thioredoxin domain-containing protein [Anaerolineales bacterium]
MNKLAQSTSPYLLQHANNPVDWYPWGSEAIEKAKAEDKPIFLSIGYAACHWCHVLAHESFENPETAAFMNENFINIKVDREERPDLDGIYMQAVVAMTGSGGWPMSVFLSHDLKPFYAGTYFPPVRRFNLPAFMDILSGLSNAWKNDRAEIEKVGEQVNGYLQNQNQNKLNDPLSREHLDAIAKSLEGAYYWGYGGWGDAPKFPQPMALEFLLHHSIANKTDEHLKLVNHCLYIMARGGMYDVVGGGFSRYSTDNFWRVPHFEKMLYDNALLARAYLHAWQVTKDPFFQRIVEETLGFVSRELTHEQGGFYSSLDADSEGVEGKFYVWTLDEIRATLKEESEFFEAAYGITLEGNWEEKTVLQRSMDDASLAARFKLNLEAVPVKLAESHSRLLSVRATRIRPGTDDKVLTAWNGLMLAAFAESARVLAESSSHSSNYLDLATRSAEFLLSNLRPDGKLHRSWRDGRITDEVFLEDYAALILGLLELYQTDFNNKWFSSAQILTDEMIEKFSDPEGGFFDTPHTGETLLFRPKDTFDNATPSGNALACEALLKMAAYTDNGKYRDLAEQSLRLISEAVLRHPLGFARWLSAMENALGNMKQIAVLGEAGEENFERMIKAIRAEYRPGVVVAASAYPPSKNAPALLEQRTLINGEATAYVCEGFVCKQPTTDVEILIAQINA